MSTPQALIYDRGTSLYFGAEALDEAGQPADLTGVDVSCTAEHKDGGDTQALELVWVDRTQGRFEFWAAGDGTCTTWRLGTWEARIVYAKASGGAGGRPLVLGTETMHLLVRKAP